MKRSENQNYKKRRRGLTPIMYFFLGVLVGVVAIAIAYAFLLKSIVEYDVGRLTRYEKVIYTDSIFKPEAELDFFDGLFVNTKSMVDTKRVGTYSVTYKVFYGNEYEKTIRVIDREPPEIKLNGEKICYAGSIETWKDPGVTAYDTTEGDLTDKVSKEIIKQDDVTYKVIYRVTDSSGYTRTARRTVKIAKGVICLTFDDGPSTQNTPKILEILKKHDIQATFFVLKFDEETKWLVARELAEGHTVGLHGYSHEYSEIYTDIDTLMNNFYKLDDLIRTEVDSAYQARFIRFPGGSSNTVSKRYCTGIMSEAVERVTSENYIYVDWNVDSDDAGSAKTADEIYSNVIGHIQTGRTNIVLMHDSGSKEQTVEALELIIQACEEKGYVFEPITEYTEVVQHGVAN